MTYLISLITKNVDLIVTLTVTLILGFGVWLITSSYKKHCEEVALLKKLEIILAYNLGALLINKSYFDSWGEAMKINRLYTCAFRTYFFLESDDLKITNQHLLNRLLKFDFSLKGFQADLNLIFIGYHDTSRMLLPDNLVEEWKNLNTNTIEQSHKYEISFNQAIEDSMTLVGFIRAYAEQMKKTPYGLFRTTIGRNLLPKISDKSIAQYKKKVEEELENNNADSNS